MNAVSTVFAWLWTNKAQVLAVVGAVLTAAKISPENQTAIMTLTGAFIGWAAIDGFGRHSVTAAAASGPTVVVNTSNHEAPHVATEAVQNALATGHESVDAPANPSPLLKTITGSGMVSKLPIVLLILMASVLSTGCASSYQFRYAASVVVPKIAAAETKFVNADATLSPSDKSSRLTDATRLQQSADNLSTIRASVVQAAWAAVEPVYRAYISANPKFTADEKAIRLANADALDHLIADELKRPLSVLSGNGPATTQP